MSDELVNYTSFSLSILSTSWSQIGKSKGIFCQNRFVGVQWYGRVDFGEKQAMPMVPRWSHWHFSKNSVRGTAAFFGRKNFFIMEFIPYISFISIFSQLLFAVDRVFRQSGGWISYDKNVLIHLLVDACDVKHSPFRNIGSMIPDPFQILRNQQKMG